MTGCPSTPAAPVASPLCPRCGSPELTVTTDVRAEFRVFRNRAGDLAVREAHWGDAEWDADAPATCRACAWQGTVARAQAGGGPGLP